MISNIMFYFILILGLTAMTINCGWQAALAGVGIVVYCLLTPPGKDGT